MSKRHPLRKKQVDFQKVDRSIKRFTDAFNRGDVSKLTAEFAPMVFGSSRAYLEFMSVTTKYENRLNQNGQAKSILPAAVS